MLSSDWKMANEKDYYYLTQKLWYKGGIRLYSQTPNIKWDRRGLEIRQWLFENPPGEFVVLDDTMFDDFDRQNLMSHVVFTDPETGLTDDDVDAAIKILNKS